MAIQFALLLILLSLMQPLASADEVLTNDGSRLIGELVRHDTEVLSSKRPSRARSRSIGQRSKK